MNRLLWLMTERTDPSLAQRLWPRAAKALQDSAELKPTCSWEGWTSKAENTKLFNSYNVFLALNGKEFLTLMSVLLFKRSWILLHHRLTGDFTSDFSGGQTPCTAFGRQENPGRSCCRNQGTSGEHWIPDSCWDSAATAPHVWWQPGDGVCVLRTRLFRGAQCCGHNSAVWLRSKDNSPCPVLSEELPGRSEVIVWAQRAGGTVCLSVSATCVLCRYLCMCLNKPCKCSLAFCVALLKFWR